MKSVSLVIGCNLYCLSCFCECVSCLRLSLVCSMELQFQCFCIFVINSVFNAPLAAYIVNSGSCGKNHVDAPESATQLYFWQTYYGGLALKCTVSLACFSSPPHQKNNNNNKEKKVEPQ